MGKRSDTSAGGETGHAEGQHGQKTHEALIEQLESGSGKRDDDSFPMHSSEGRHRLTEDREQRDEAEKNSEANRMRAEVERGRLDPDTPGVGDRLNGMPHSEG